MLWECDYNTHPLRTLRFREINTLCKLDRFVDDFVNCGVLQVGSICRVSLSKLYSSVQLLGQRHEQHQSTSALPWQHAAIPLLRTKEKKLCLNLMEWAGRKINICLNLMEWTGQKYGSCWYRDFLSPRFAEKMGLREVLGKKKSFLPICNYCISSIFNVDVQINFF